MRISQDFTFEAAQRLPNVPEGHRCSRMHGHSYRTEVLIDGTLDPRSGSVVDVFDVVASLAPLMERLDHHCLNEGLEHPSAENNSMWIWNRLSPSLSGLALVTVFETPNCWAEYDGRPS